MRYTGRGEEEGDTTYRWCVTNWHWVGVDFECDEDCEIQTMVVVRDDE